LGGGQFGVTNELSHFITAIREPANFPKRAITLKIPALGLNECNRDLSTVDATSQ
jgi:hypothetical protein